MSAEPTPGEKTGHEVPAVVKTVAIIRMLNSRGTEGATLADVVSALDMSRSHCHNILRTLVDCGWLGYEPGSRIYRLSALLSADTASGLISEPFLGTFRVILERFGQIVKMPVGAIEPLPDGSYLQLLMISHAETSPPTAPAGFRFPKGMPVHFKAQYAWTDLQTRAAAVAKLTPLSYTPNTIVDKAEILRDLELCRARGYTRALGEYIEGAASLGLPVFDANGQVILIVSCATKQLGFESVEKDAARALIACVHHCHTAIDGRPPVDFPRPEI